jgi:hypothetical protein
MVVVVVVVVVVVIITTPGVEGREEVTQGVSAVCVSKKGPKAAWPFALHTMHGMCRRQLVCMPVTISADKDQQWTG